MSRFASLIEGIDPSKPVLLAGPTASGKSDFAMALAETQSRVIVNADALQVYDCWRVLSARPSDADEARVPHFLYGHQGFESDYSVGAWLREVSTVLETHPRAILVGGTGLYFTALTEGLSDIPPIPAAVRARADEMRLHARAQMVADLEARDPITSAHIDLLNPMRVQRAWEVLEATGRGLKAWQDATPPARLPAARAEAMVVHTPRDVLEARLTTRFDKMLTAGALDEVRALLAVWDPSRPASRAIGAPELVAYLRGECTLSESREGSIIATRQYAKRQRTWFRSRMRDWRPIEFPMS